MRDRIAKDWPVVLLSGELPQVMIEMLIHQHGPLLGIQAAEEHVWMRCETFRAAGDNLIEEGQQITAFRLQVTFAHHDE